MKDAEKTAAFDLYARLGRAMSECRFGESLSLCAELLRMFPGDAGVMSEVGWLAYLMGEYGEAITWLRQALDTSPDYLNTFCWTTLLGKALLASGDAEACHALCATDLGNQLRCHSSPTVFERGVVIARALAAMGRSEDAIDEYRQLVSMARIAPDGRSLPGILGVVIEELAALARESFRNDASDGPSIDFPPKPVKPR